MLSDDLKRQFFDWIGTRLSWLKVVMLGNRSHELDHMLMSELKTKLGSKSMVVIEALSARLDIEKILAHQISDVRRQFCKNLVLLLVAGFKE